MFIILYVIAMSIWPLDQTGLIGIIIYIYVFAFLSELIIWIGNKSRKNVC